MLEIMKQVEQQQVTESERRLKLFTSMKEKEAEECKNTQFSLFSQLFS
jgi:hypothetical protein